MQLDLFGRPILNVLAPDDAKEPRLWVRRLVIWSEPWTAVRPPIDFRPGLNIIWSPDPAEQPTRSDGRNATGPGHGAGKTLVCRLLRYCLGEPSFASEGQRTKISRAFREGRVGAEIVIDGVPWAVVRSIGIMPFDMVREGSSLEQAISGAIESTGMDALLNALTDNVLGAPVAALISKSRELAWLAALEWIARDQECRFGKVTDWRNASSDSGSPRLSAGRATNVVRALLGAITPAEQKLEQDVIELDKRRDQALRTAERFAWAINRSIPRIAKAIDLTESDLPAGELVVPRLRTAATNKIARIATVDSKGEIASLDDLEKAFDTARSDVQRIEQELAQALAKQKAAETIAAMIEKERPGLATSIDNAEAPPCPICEVPIDRARAEGCKLSHKLPDLSALQRRHAEAERDLRDSRDEIERTKTLRDELKPQLERAKTTRDAAWQTVLAARRLQKERGDTWYAARRAGDDIREVESLFSSKATAEAEMKELDVRLTQARNDAAAERNQHADVFAQLAKHFDPLVRRLLGADAKGEVTHDGNGIHLGVEFGGDRSTPAIDSVKILAFDLAAMCRGIEGKTHLPALLIHDSPREADLGLSIYHELFRLMTVLEKTGGAPLFQYIVTTTTRPPEELAALPWLRVTLHGAPAKDRLLGRDL